VEASLGTVTLMLVSLVIVFALALLVLYEARVAVQLYLDLRATLNQLRRSSTDQPELAWRAGRRARKPHTRRGAHERSSSGADQPSNNGCTRDESTGNEEGGD
jgi:hypothetical protein